MTPIQAKLELQYRLEQFYYREARLLDERQYQQWLGLLSEDVSYTMPSRHVAQTDNRLRGREDFLAVEHELSPAGAGGAPLREENYFVLAIRVERAFKMNSWAENPPARTRRFVSNVELLSEGGDGDYQVCSNFMLHYSRHGRDNYTYSGQRRDILREVDDSFKITRREIILDWSVIVAPTVGLFF